MKHTSKKISQYTTIFASGTFVSRILGMIRDIYWAKAVPATSLDAFLVAFRLPNMLRDLVGEGAMNAAFIPVFSETREKQSEEAFRKLVQSSMGAMLLVLLMITLAGMVFVPGLVSHAQALRFITGGQEKEEEHIAFLMTLCRWTFPYIFFIGMTVFAMGPLMTLGKYVAASWSPALLNLSFIGVLLAIEHFSPSIFPDISYALVLGTWLGGISQLLVLYISLGRATRIWLPRFHLAYPGVREIFSLMVPVIIGQAAGEINKLVDTFFAYSLESGTVTALFYANRLVQLPLSLFGFATAAAILPAVSNAWARADTDDVRKTLQKGLRQTIFLILPAAFGLMILGKAIVWLLFERGNFSERDTLRTASALAIYASGLIWFALVKVTVTGFYGAKDTRTPVIISSLSMLLNILLNCLLVRPLGYRGLALATSISYAVNFFALFILLSDKCGKLWDKEFFNAVFRITIAAITSLAVSYGIHLKLIALFPQELLPLLRYRLTTTLIPILSACGIYFLLCMALQVPETAFATNFFVIAKNRVTRKK